MPAIINPTNPIGFLTPFGPREINEIPLDAVIQEEIDHELVVTEHPIEVASGQGVIRGTVSDNAYRRPTVYFMQAAVSNFPISWRLVVDRYSNATAETRSLSAYQLLLKHFQEMVPFTLRTPFGDLDNMLFLRFTVPRNQQNSSAIVFRAIMREIQVVVPDAVSKTKTEEDVSGDQAETQAIEEKVLGITSTVPA